MASEKHTTAVGFDSQLGDKREGFYPVSITISYKSSLKTPECHGVHPQRFH